MIGIYRDGVRLYRWFLRPHWRLIRGIGLGVEWQPGPSKYAYSRWTWSRIEIRLGVLWICVEHISTIGNYKAWKAQEKERRPRPLDQQEIE